MENDMEYYDEHEYKPTMFKKGQSLQYDTSMELFVIKPSQKTIALLSDNNSGKQV